MAAPTPRQKRADYRGPALFSYGFRPFFLAAGLFAFIAVPYWAMVFTRGWDLHAAFNPVDWHIHEMLFGYTSAVIAGFLFTAIPNWTGRMPARGTPLAVLLALWLAGRLAMAGVGGLSGWALMAVDGSFLLAIAAMICVEIVAGKNWRNLKVVVPVLAYGAANLFYHREVMLNGTADYSVRAGFLVVIFLITLIGGRIIPSFTRNWMNQRQMTPLPTPFNRYDVLCLITGVAAMGSWALAAPVPIAVPLLLVAAILHLIRLTRWRGIACWRAPLLLMLHVAYLFIPLGFMALAGEQFSPSVPSGTGVHLLGTGAIAGMTVAVMMRATLGHTGQALIAGPVLTAAFVTLIAAALTRSLGGATAVPVAAALWALAYGIFMLRIGPALLRANSKRKQPSVAR